MRFINIILLIMVLVSCQVESAYDKEQEWEKQVDDNLELIIQDLNNTFNRNRDIDPCLNQRMITTSVFGSSTYGHLIFDNLNASFILVAPFNLTNTSEQDLGKTFHCGSDIAVYFVPPNNNMTTREMMMNKTQFENLFNISGNQIREYVRYFSQNRINDSVVFFNMERVYCTQ